jgi:hypothetical protein
MTLFFETKKKFQTNQPTRCNNFSSLLLDVYLQPRPTALLSQSSGGKPEAATAVVVVPDYGREVARNMLSCT